jgi:hypothetical protein
MKKVGVYLFISLIIISINIPVYANKDKNVEVNAQKEKCENEKKSKSKKMRQVLDEIANREDKYFMLEKDVADTTIKTYSLEDAYKVNIIDPLMITQYNNGKSFASLITDEVHWIVPVRNKVEEPGYATLIESENDLEWIGTSFGGEQAHMLPDIDTVFHKIEETVDDSLQSVQYVHSPFYSVTFVYFSTLDEEYVMPFSAIADEMSIENQKVYTVENMFSILNKVFDESIAIENSDSNGGIPFRKQSFPKGALIVMVISFFNILICIKILYNKKKLKIKGDFLFETNKYKGN